MKLMGNCDLGNQTAAKAIAKWQETEHLLYIIWGGEEINLRIRFLTILVVFICPLRYRHKCKFTNLFCEIFFLLIFLIENYC